MCPSHCRYGTVASTSPTPDAGSGQMTDIRPNGHAVSGDVGSRVQTHSGRAFLAVGDDEERRRPASMDLIGSQAGAVLTTLATLGAPKFAASAAAVALQITPTHSQPQTKQ